MADARVRGFLPWFQRARVRARLRGRRARVGLAIVAAVAVYAALGFWLAPYLIRTQVPGQVREAIGCELVIHAARVHPFKLWVELSGIELRDRAGVPLLEVDRFALDIAALSSLWSRAYVFKAIALEGPRLRVAIRPDGSMNLADLSSVAKPSQPAEPEPPPAVWVQSFSLDGGRVRFEDCARASCFVREFERLTLAVQNLRTTARGGSFELATQLSDGTALAWRGQVAVTPELSSTGRLTLSDFPLASAAEYLAEALPVGSLRGQAGLRARYTLALGKSGKFEGQLDELTLAGVQLRARTAAGGGVDLDALQVNAVRVALPQRELSVGSVIARGLRTTARFDADGELNLLQLLPRSRASAAPKAADESKPWSFQIARIALEDAGVTVEQGPGRVQLSPIQLTVTDLSSDVQRPFSVSARVAVERGGQLSASGPVTLAPFGADLELEGSGVDLALAQPYIRERASFTLDRGTLALHGKLALRPTAAPKLAFSGGVKLENLRTLDNAQRQDLFTVRTMELTGLRLTAAPQSVEVARVALIEPYARVLLRPDGSLNLTTALATPVRKVEVAPARAEGAAAQTPAGQAAAAPVQVAAAPQAQAQVKAAAAQTPAGQAAAVPVAATVRGAAGPQAQATAGAAGKQPAADEPLPVRVQELALQRMRMNFSDTLIKPHFTLDLHHVRGTVRGITSDRGARAVVALQGTLGDNAPVRIDGTLRPFAYDRNSDIRIRADNISLPIFNPYSGRFAGYNITRGELSTEVHYQLRNRTLEAAHNIRVDQLKWGEATETKDAAPLPVKLATVLLRDRNGVINLDLPLHGTLDDPSFSVWPLIFQVLENICIKAVTAPFDMLAAVFSGAQDAQFVDFEPGSAELPARSKAALDALSKALADREELTLDVPIASLPAIDRPGLVERKLEAQLAEALARDKSLRKTARDFVSLPVEDQIDLLEDVLDDRYDDSPSVPDPPPPKPGLSDDEVEAAEQEFELQFLKQALRSKLRASDEELEQLGRARGEAIERALAGGGKLATSRVLLSRDGKAEVEQGRARLKLELR